MDRGRLRWGLRVAALVVGGAALLLWLVQRQNQDRVKIENRAGQPIAVLKLTVAGQDTTFRHVPSGADVSAPFAVETGDAFAVQGELSDGSLIRASGTIAYERFILTIAPQGKTTVRDGSKG